MIKTHRYFQVYIPFALLSCLISGTVYGLEIAGSILITNVIFGLNLWGGIWIIQIVLEAIKNPESGSVLQFFVGLKFFLFILSIIVIFLAFGWVPVLVSNSLIILTIILTTLYFEIYPEEDM